MTAPRRTSATRLVHPLTPFVDPLPIPPRRLVGEPTRLTMRVEAAWHRFHRDLPPSRVWTYGGLLPGRTVEVPRGVPVEVQWENHLEGTLPVTVVRVPRYEEDGVPVQCLPGRTGGERDAAAAALPGYSVGPLSGHGAHPPTHGLARKPPGPRPPGLGLL